MMDEFKELVGKAQVIWEASGDFREGFANGCAALLKEYDLELGDIDALESLISKVELPKQHFDHNGFADFAVTLARSRDCFLDIYIWQNRSTNYHSHHFCGAFKALRGKARQANLKFEMEKDYEYMRTGKLTLVSTNDLNEGDVQAIAPGDSFIHRNHYVQRPGVTLCLRSKDLPNINIYSFFYPGLAVKLQKLESSKLRHLRLVEFMIQNKQMNKRSLNSFYEALPEWFKHELLTGFTRAQFIIELPELLDELEKKAKEDQTLNESLRRRIDLCRKDHVKKIKRDMMLLESSGWKKNE